MMGANPKASNGSLATAPDWPGRMTAIRERGGRIVPRRSEAHRVGRTRRRASVHPPRERRRMALPLSPRRILRSGNADVGRLAAHARGLDSLGDLLTAFDADSVVGLTGIPRRRRAASHPNSSPPHCCGVRATRHARRGVRHSGIVAHRRHQPDHRQPRSSRRCDVPDGGHRDTAPQAIPDGPVDQPSVREHPEALGELPVAALAEEILTPGQGQIRALITVAGNPARSTPDSVGLAKALDSLDLMISIDPYRNETTSHADVILPPPSHLERSHYDLAFWQLSVRNVANYSPRLSPITDGRPDEWEIPPPDCNRRGRWHGCRPRDARRHRHGRTDRDAMSTTPSRRSQSVIPVRSWRPSPTARSRTRLGLPAAHRSVWRRLRRPRWDHPCRSGVGVARHRSGRTRAAPSRTPLHLRQSH